MMERYRALSCPVWCCYSYPITQQRKQLLEKKCLLSDFKISLFNLVSIYISSVVDQGPETLGTHAGTRRVN